MTCYREILKSTFKGQYENADFKRTVQNGLNKHSKTTHILKWGFSNDSSKGNFRVQQYCFKNM